ncbi:helix-turn-helix transcriptional regulator [Kitasatospora sp. NBC_00240]|uniref:helix-turn-helix transcriptional regulator n=1 Tax=Kitasatospora sp. NBC_00240 TaxID=2903567 RepID=UPI00224DB83E|nr:helix-turn-helix transcriptional regulator [Kitasatospora sp. NBC_00240]MCX5212716.1 helix-turn-helix transcriptional regulator [Kitasatospora sp. NBC_00240]
MERTEHAQTPGDSDAVRLYARLLTDPGRPPGAPDPGWTGARLAAATAELRALGLLQPTAADTGGHAAVSVDTAVRQLLLDTDTQVTALVAALGRARDAVGRLHDGYLPVQERHRAEHPLELVRGADRIAALLEDAARGARTEALSLRPGQDASEPALAGKLARERLALAHGVAMRTVYPAAALRRPTVLAHLRELTAAGAHIRVAHTLPLWLICVDARLAILPAADSDHAPGSLHAPGADPAEAHEPRAAAAVLVREPALVAMIRELFEYFWAGAWTPPELLTGDRAPAEPADRHQEVLRLLAAGLTDAAIGRKLEVSERTVRRLVAELIADLGADSRFQAGVHAARLGRL